MVKNNFQCLKCGLEFHESHYHFTVSMGEIIYKNKNGIIRCPECKGSELEFINKNTDFSSIQIGKFASSTPEEKKRILKKRAQEHNKKTKDEALYRKAKVLKKALNQ